VAPPATLPTPASTDARLVQIPGHAHEAYLTAPDVLAEEIRRFTES
jgi:hypothetical protein